MVLRSVKPLDAEEWKYLMKCLDEGPDEEQREFTRKAEKFYKEITERSKAYYNDDDSN